MELLLEDGRANPGWECNYPLHIALKYASDDIVIRMLNDGRVDLAEGGHKLLENAVKFNRTRLTKLLLTDKQVHPSDKGSYPLFLAVGSGNVSTLKAILDDNRTKLTHMMVHFAAENCNSTTLSMLLNNYRIVANEMDLADLEEEARAGGPENQEVVRQWRADADL